MSFFTNLRADRLVTEIRSATDPSQPGDAEGDRAAEGGRSRRDRSRVRRTAGRRQVGHRGVRRRAGEPRQPEDLPAVHARPGRGQPAGDRRHLLGTHQQPQLPAHMLIEALATPGIPKPAILEVIAAQKTRFTVRELLNAAYTQEPNEKAALFRIIGEIADNERGARAHRPRAGQGPDRARAHHQYPGALQHPGGADRAAGAAEGPQQADPRRHALGAAAHGRADRHRAGLRAAARPRDRRAEPRHRRRHQGQPPRDHPLPDRRPQGRERERAPRRGRGAERGRQRRSRSSTCSRRSRTATGGCAAVPPMRSARSAARR